MGKKILCAYISIVLAVFFTQGVCAFSYTESEFAETLANLFSSENEGLTSFRSLLIPTGGRAESMGNAFTGLCDDIGFFNHNPAGSSVQTQTQLAATHNSWIADSKLESLAFTSRAGNFGFGGQVSCFYLPFTEYNFFGDKTNISYYSETAALINFSYNFLQGYNFKGISVGVNLKGAWRGMPDYCDNDTDAIIQGSGLEQSSLGLMADVGILIQFNFLKFYSLRETNIRIGLALLNAGIALTGFGNSVILDDPVPTVAAAGVSWRIAKPFVLSIDFKQPLYLDDLGQYILFSLGAGFSVQFTDFFSVCAGLELKGGNPRITAGCEFELLRLRMGVNYTLDMTSSAAPVNRISFSAKVLIGDKGRADTQSAVDRLYSQGLTYYSNGEWEKAIETWQKVLELDKNYDPAILGIKSAQAQLDMLEKINSSLVID